NDRPYGLKRNAFQTENALETARQTVRRDASRAATPQGEKQPCPFSPRLSRTSLFEDVLQGKKSFARRGISSPAFFSPAHDASGMPGRGKRACVVVVPRVPSGKRSFLPEKEVSKQYG
ncbi:hypothetical protein, partial [uncultured Desulfovibrio sp.]|uniref:hypothetical protein n=1 Tax=uncultured Desulfovibrio sp. TaxID=167968 RepID=UPI00262F485B